MTKTSIRIIRRLAETFRWRVYIVECADGSLYTGISTDPDRRFAQHKAGKGAKYFRAHPAHRLLWYNRKGYSRSEASSMEAMIKKWTRETKIKFLKRHNVSLSSQPTKP